MPHSHKLGVRAIKGELEDLSLKVLDPESIQDAEKEDLGEKRREGEEDA